MKKKVVVAMSGGVDSSVAAAVLKKRGYDVTGVTMDLFALPKNFCRDENLRSCCGRRAVEDAHRVAVCLNIPHYVVDLKKSFEKKVINNFCKEYTQGHTPNPCIRCNQFIKFAILMERAEKIGADYIATGHHARVVYDPDKKRYLLKKGKDQQKDQSYFLYILTQKQLKNTLMPIGDFTKEEVRKTAKKFDLPVAQREESQEICFIPDNDYVRFLRDRIPEAFCSGLIVDKENRVLGRHDGILNFTIGQRRGMKIAAPHPLYVIDIQMEENKVVAGTSEALYRIKLLASRVNLISEAKIDKPIRIKAKIRYRHKEAYAELTPLNSGQFLVTFEKPQRAITPGQAVVFYEKDTVVGGGTIDRSL